VTRLTAFTLGRWTLLPAVLVLAFLGVAGQAAAAGAEQHRYLPALSRIFTIDEVKAGEEPCGMAIDAAGNRYISIPELFSVQVFDPSGTKLTEFETSGNFELPCDLAVAPDGAVYVDDFAGMVVKYVPSEPLGDGSDFEVDETAGEEGVIVEEGARGIAVDPVNGNLLAGEDAQITEYDPDGNVLRDSIGSAVVGAEWGGVDVDGTTGDVYAIDMATDSVDVFSGTDGALKATIDGSADPSFRAGFGSLLNADLAVDQATGNFYLNDTAADQGVPEFSATGEFVALIGPWVGEGEEKLESLPAFGAVAVDNSSAHPGTVFVPAQWLNFPNLGLGIYAFEGALSPAPAPTVANSDPTGIAKTEATLKGTVDNEGAQSASTCKFVLALASAPLVPLAEPACNVNPITGNASKAVQAKVESLLSGTAYVYEVVATNAGGTATPGAQKEFSTLAEAPTVTAIDPARGPVAGGTTVTITGTNLAGATAVEFGAANPATIVSGGPTQIVATAPPGSAGPVDVTVTTAGGTSAASPADQFTYMAPVALKVSKTGTGGGAVRCDGGECAATYPFGAEVTLTAAADPGSSFVGWSGAGCTGTGPCVVTLAAEAAVGAEFAAESSPGGNGDNGGGGSPGSDSAAPSGNSSPAPTSPTPPAPAVGTPKPASSATVRGGKAAIAIACNGSASCTGKLTVTTSSRGKKVKLGTARYSIAAGRSKTVSVPLSKQGREMLAARGTLKVKVSGPGFRGTVRLKESGRH